MTDQSTNTTASGRPFERRGRRHLGQAVRVADTGDRYHGTRGVLVEYCPAFGTMLYRVASARVRDHGVEEVRPGWRCLFFPDQLRGLARNSQDERR